MVKIGEMIWQHFQKKELKLMDEYFRVLNYISVGQLYLLDNPLLKKATN